MASSNADMDTGALLAFLVLTCLADYSLQIFDELMQMWNLALWQGLSDGRGNFCSKQSGTFHYQDGSTFRWSAGRAAVYNNWSSSVAVSGISVEASFSVKAGARLFLLRHCGSLRRGLGVSPSGLCTVAGQGSALLEPAQMRDCSSARQRSAEQAS